MPDPNDDLWLMQYLYLPICCPHACHALLSGLAKHLSLSASSTPRPFPSLRESGIRRLCWYPRDLSEVIPESKPLRFHSGQSTARQVPLLPLVQEIWLLAGNRADVPRDRMREVQSL
jgi:hypothetical protein